MPSYDTAQLRIRDDDVAELTLDRPEKQNALSPQLHRDLHTALEEIEETDARVILLQGSGDAFCGGMDLEKAFLQPRREGPQAFREENKHVYEVAKKIYRNRLPTVAKLDGWTFGAGIALMGMCDFAIASDDVTFGLSEVNFGIFPGGGTMWAVAHSMGRRKAMYYSATGVPFDAEEAEDTGLITKAVPEDELDDEIDELIGELKNVNPVTLHFNKQVLDRSRFMKLEESIDYEMTKLEEMSYYQGQDWIETALDKFEDREYRPGFEKYLEQD